MLYSFFLISPHIYIITFKEISKNNNIKEKVCSHKQLQTVDTHLLSLKEWLRREAINRAVCL